MPKRANWIEAANKLAVPIDPRSAGPEITTIPKRPRLSTTSHPSARPIALATAPVPASRDDWVAVAGGGILLAAGFLSIALRPVGPDSVTPLVAVLLLAAAGLLLLGLPALHLVQAETSGAVGLAGHALLTIGLLLLVLVSAAPILFPGEGLVAPEDAVLFVLALALTGGLLATSVAWRRAAVLPPAAALLLLLGALAFFFAFFALLPT